MGYLSITFFCYTLLCNLPLPSCGKHYPSKIYHYTTYLEYVRRLLPAHAVPRHSLNEQWKKMNQETKRRTIVLYADDDAEERAMMELGFSAWPGFQLRTFPDAIALLSNLLETDPGDICAIIFDNNMPKLKGIDAIKEIHGMQLLHNIPVVLLTTGLPAHEIILCNSLNAKLVIKPGTLAELEAEIRKIISPGLTMVND